MITMRFLQIHPPFQPLIIITQIAILNIKICMVTAERLSKVLTTRKTRATTRGDNKFKKPQTGFKISKITIQSTISKIEMRN